MGSYYQKLSRKGSFEWSNRELWQLNRLGLDLLRFVYKRLAHADTPT
jgi:hypothetical protein